MLIVLEGLDGAGKSTQVKLLTSYLESQGRNVQYLHFPRFDAPVYGDLIAKFLRGDFGAIDAVHPQLVALLFAEDRRDAAALIRSWLAEGSCIILDRYVYSNIAFQCAKIASEQEASTLRDWIFDLEYGRYDIPRTDLNIFLAVPIGFVDEKLKNARSGDDREYLQGKNDIHEADLSFQQRVRAAYLAQCETDEGFRRIDCSDADGRMLPADAIFAKIKEQLPL